MKVTVYKPVELEIHTVRIEVELHDDVSENLPKHLFNDDGELDLLIEVDTGKVVSWQGNEPVSIHDNIRNNGVYTLFDKCGDEVARLDNYYLLILKKISNGKYDPASPFKYAKSTIKHANSFFLDILDFCLYYK